ncbi:MAG: penicillin-binding protein 2 [Calditrichaeota bacterium]|nr:penicillin-binding protein 2 [Calditrichota bacterium]
MNHESDGWWRDNRGIIFLFFVLLIFGVLDIKLFSMQVLNRPDFLKKAATNRIRAEVIEPTRGKIFDRNGKLLVENRPSYSLYARPWTIIKEPQTIDSLAAVLDLETSVVKKRLGARGWHTFYPTPLQRDLSFDKLAYLEATQLNYPGISFRFEMKRSYLFPETVHLLGYVGERSTKESEGARGRFGFVGKKGIELIYEDWLGGEAGVKYQQVDVSGRIIGELSNPKAVKATPGWDIHLNIDAELQRYAYELMDGRDGSVVAIDPRNGEVLVLLSLPVYDPSVFAGVLPQDVWDALQFDPGHPLLNRAVQGTYPPGSTFKMAILAAALEEGVADSHTRITCGGGMQLGRRWFKCWKSGGHGSVGQYKAIQQSCDVFFYNMGLGLGADRMAKYCKMFGFGMRTGIDMDSEVTGISPSSRYLDKKYGKGKWTRGQLLNISIGQGDVLVTPVQLAVFTAAISTGELVQPQLVNRIINPVSGEVNRFTNPVRDIDISSETMNILREGMRMVVNEPHGTAYWLCNPDLTMAGKTGTAQNPHGEDHGLFVGYAPFERPLIAVAVIVEHGEHGSTAAAPVVCRLMERYINDIFPGPKPAKVIPVAVTASSDSVGIDSSNVE